MTLLIEDPASGIHQFPLPVELVSTGGLLCGPVYGQSVLQTSYLLAYRNFCAQRRRGVDARRLGSTAKRKSHANNLQRGTLTRSPLSKFHSRIQSTLPLIFPKTITMESRLAGFTKAIRFMPLDASQKIIGNGLKNRSRKSLSILLVSRASLTG